VLCVSDPLLVPHWNQAVVASPFGVTVPFNVPPVEVTELAAPVVATGAPPAGLKVALTARAALIVTLHVELVPALAQSPPQPPNSEPDDADAVSVTPVPAL
jgi:hypothetical protein